MAQMLESKCEETSVNEKTITSDNLIQTVSFQLQSVFLDETQTASFLDLAPFKKAISTTFSCEGSWMLFQVNENEERGGLTFQVYSEKLSPSILREFTVLTIYTSVVLVLGSLLKEMFITGTHRIQFQMMSNSDSLLVLCEQIVLMRRQGRLDREEQLYFTLMEVMRSSELIKELTGPNLPEKRAIMVQQSAVVDTQWQQFQQWKDRQEKQEEDEWQLLREEDEEREREKQRVVGAIRSSAASGVMLKKTPTKET